MYAFKPKKIGDLVSEYVTTYADQPSVRRGVVLHRFRDTVGPLMADHCKTLRFDSKNRLILTVPDAAWRHEINMQRMHIRELLNREAGGEIITDRLVRA